MPGGVRLFDELTVQTLKTVKKTGLPYFLFSEKEQFGASFGERFSNAIESVFNKGYDNIITVGNDTPHLTKTHIQKAYRALESETLVLGPSADGGFYLLGLSRFHFNPEEFKKLSWQTSKVANEISSQTLRDGGSILRLQSLFDLDDEEDLQKFVNRFRGFSKKLAALIQKLLAVELPINKELLLFYNSTFLSLKYNKGSPGFTLS